MCKDKCCSPAEQLEKDENEDLFKNNKYLSDETDYDLSEILVDGVIPEFKSEAEKLDCATRLAHFIRSNGICKQERNLAKFLAAIGTGPRACFCWQQTTETLEYMVRQKEFVSLMDAMINDVEHEEYK